MLYHISMIQSRAAGRCCSPGDTTTTFWATWVRQSCWGAVIREMSLKTLMPLQFSPNSPSPYICLIIEQCRMSVTPTGEVPPRLVLPLSQVCLPEERNCWEAEPFHWKMSFFSYSKCCLFLMKGEEKQDSPQRLNQQFTWQPTRWHNTRAVTWGAEFLANQTRGPWPYRGQGLAQSDHQGLCATWQLWKEVPFFFFLHVFLNVYIPFCILSMPSVLWWLVVTQPHVRRIKLCNFKAIV